MSYHPHSCFGYGVVLDRKSLVRQENAPSGSPQSLLESGDVDENGVSIVEIGSCHEPLFLVAIYVSLNMSKEYMPERIRPVQMTVQPWWCGAIMEYVSKWGLKPMPGFERPSLVHAPYYG